MFFFCLIIVEIINYIFTCWSYQSYQDTTIELDKNCSLTEWQNFVKSRLEWIQLNHPDWIKEMFSKSFWGIPFEKIALSQLRAALEMYYIRQQTPNSLSEQEVDPWVNEFCKQVAQNNTEYTDKKIEWIRINSKETKHHPPKPLYLPFCISSLRYLIRFIYDNYLRIMNYKKFTCSIGINYWYLNNGKFPMLVAHGIGFGSIPYTFFNRRLSQNNSIFLIELPGISCYYPKKMFPRPDEIVMSVLEATEYFQIKKMDAIGHSYGAIILTYLVNSIKFNNVINKKIFIEPPIFIAGITKSWPETYRKFTYKDLLNYRIGAIGEWYNQQLIHNGCWLHDITHREKSMGENTLVILTPEDALVDSEKISIYLNEKFHKVTLFTHEKGQHSDSIFIYLKKTVEIISKFIDKKKIE